VRLASILVTHSCGVVATAGDPALAFPVPDGPPVALAPWSAVAVAPDLPPLRLRALSARVRALCVKHGVRYVEYPSAWASYLDKFLYLLRLSWPRRRG
jgi:hypothetical protein